MVEANQADKAQIVLTTLRQAESDGSFEKSAEWQEVTFKEVEDKLAGIATFEDQIELLQDEYPCLYFLVSKVLGIDTSEYIEFCRQFEEDKWYELYTYYVHGCIHPELDELRAQEKIIQRTWKRQIRMGSNNAQLTGEFNEETKKVHGKGIAVDDNKSKYEGIWKDNKRGEFSK